MIVFIISLMLTKKSMFLENPSEFQGCMLCDYVSASSCNTKSKQETLLKGVQSLILLVVTFTLTNNYLQLYLE